MLSYTLLWVSKRNQDFVKHANRCFPWTSTNHSSDDAHDQKLIQYKLNQVGIRKQAKLSLKEKNELKNLYAE